MKISVILANFNHGNLLNCAIDSILMQDHSKWELILVDDCSTDNSLCLIKRYALKDSRIKPFFLSKNIGSNLAYKHGLKHAEGDLLFFLAADDRLSDKSFFCDAVAAMKSNSLSVGFYGKSDFICGETGLELNISMGGSMSGEGYISGSDFVRGFLSNKTFVPSSSAIWRLSNYLNTDYFRSDLGPYSDWYTNHLLPAEKGIIYKDKTYTKFALWDTKKNFGNSIGPIKKVMILNKVKYLLQKNSIIYKNSKGINLWFFKRILRLLWDFFLIKK
jgi:glycosyltransferase involved in cell wall biosynthesis